MMLHALLLLAVLVPMSASSTNEVSVPAKFVRVHSADEITDETLLLIGSFTIDGAFNLMSSDIRDEKWLKAEDTVFKEFLTISNPACCWQLKRYDDGSYRLYSVSADAYVYVPNANKVPVELQAGKAARWTLLEKANGIFSLQNQAESKRFLGIYELENKYFGNYTAAGADNIDLYFYKQAKTTVDLPGEAVLPADGAAVALLGGEALLGADAEAKELSRFLLCDGSIAADESLGTLTCRHLSSEEKRFELEKDGKYLDYSLQYGAAHTPWQILNGYISTTETTPRHLVYADRFVLADAEQAVQALCAVFMPVGEEPTADYDAANRCKSLRGGWSAQRLAGLDWEEALSLDLTRISLPLCPLPFTNRPAGSNTVIYIDEADADAVPVQWDFVVSCGDKEAVLLDAAVLTDKAGFNPVRSFMAGEGRLVYEREAFSDGSWETLYVPFDADLPEGFVVESFEGLVRATGELRFAEADYIPANTPLIMRYAGNSGTEKVSFRIQNRGGEVTLPETESSIFAGVYLPKTLTAGDTGIYLLDGEFFVLGKAGSLLPPFRAYMYPGQQSGRLTISHPATSVSLPDYTERRRQTPCYTLDGTKVCDNLTDKVLQSLPSGFYIAGGRKFLK